MSIDMPLSELEQYQPILTAADNFDAFWQQALAESAAQALDATWEEHPYPVERVTVYKVRYAGLGPATRVAVWYLLPVEPILLDGKIPTIVIYHGYSGSKGLPTRYLNWALQGYAVFAVDTRGQNGETPDNAIYADGSALGCMSKGILDPNTYYYRYAYIDCVRAIDCVRTRLEVGPIIITGRSQGGGLTLAVAALAKNQGIVAAMPDVPYLCHFSRAIEVFLDGPYQELVEYWKSHPYHVEKSYHTLSYFDGMNFAARIDCPVLLSIALRDTICPPSTGFAVYNHLASPKELKVYAYNGHEGGDEYHEEEQYRFVRSILA